MREDRLDEEIRRILQEIQEDYDESSWDKLSQRIDEQGLSTEDDIDFDEQVKYKLERHSIPPSEEHWQVFNEELDNLEHRRRRVYIVKILEATIFLLLVMTFLNYTQFRSQVDINNDYISQVQIESTDIGVAQASLAQPNPISSVAIAVDDQKTPRLSGAETVRIWLAEDHALQPISFLPTQAISTVTSKNHDIIYILERLAIEPQQSFAGVRSLDCLLYTSPSPRDQRGSRMPSSA